MNEIQLLRHVSKASEMGRIGIDAVLRRSEEAKLTLALSRQREEYRQIQDEAERLLRDRGAAPRGVGAMAKLSSQVMSTVKTAADPSAGKIAEMMIQGSTMGVTKSLRAIRDCGAETGPAWALAEKLLQTEQANIEEMKQFL